MMGLRNNIRNKIPYKVLVISQAIKRFLLTNFFRLRGFQILISNSQQLEDIYIFNELFPPIKFIKNMHIVEVGAFDGRRYSNTFMLENKFQLKTLLIEPEPNNYKKILKNRPKSTCLNYAISHKEEYVKFLCGGAVGGISSKMNEEHKKASLPCFGKEIEILALPLSKLLKENSVKEIYLLSIDCEGGDLDVLKSINFMKFFIHIILIETTHNKSEIKELMSARGFYLKRNLFLNQIWVNTKSNIISKAVKPSRPIAWKTLFLENFLKKESKNICSKFKQKNIFY